MLTYRSSKILFERSFTYYVVLKESLFPINDEKLVQEVTGSAVVNESPNQVKTYQISSRIPKSA